MYIVQAVSGRYISQSFNPENGDFSVVFAASASLAPQPTIIYLNEKFYYPNGYNVRYVCLAIASAFGIGCAILTMYWGNCIM